MDQEHFQGQFEARLRLLLLKALPLAEQGTIATTAFSSVVNFMLVRGVASGEVAALLRKLADELDDHAAELRRTIN